MRMPDMKSSVDRIGTFKYMATIARSRQVEFIHRMCPDESGESEVESVEGTFIISMSKKAVVLTKRNQAGIQAPFIVKAWKRDDTRREWAKTLGRSSLHDPSYDSYEDADGGEWHVFNSMDPLGERVTYHPPTGTDDEGVWYSIALKPY
jgi:hypothetical protein